MNIVKGINSSFTNKIIKIMIKIIIFLLEKKMRKNKKSKRKNFLISKPSLWSSRICSPCFKL